jgi:hypothetical protein
MVTDTHISPIEESQLADIDILPPIATFAEG